MSGINIHGVLAIYRSEMARTRRTILQSIATPVITTALYFIVFGGAIGSRMQHVGGVGYGAFIVPGLIMLSLLTQSISNASVGIYFPNSPGPCSRSSRPLNAIEAVIAYVGAAATKSVIIGLIILATSTFFTDVRILHPVWMVAFLLLTSIAFSLFGFIIGIWAKSFEQLSIIPSLIVTPLTFLGGAFYSIDMLPRMAHGQPVQSRRLSGQRLPLELLWPWRCQRRGQPGLHGLLHGGVSGRALVDFPHGLASEALRSLERGLGNRRASGLALPHARRSP
jgi:ABC-2 type transport system permease protein